MAAGYRGLLAFWSGGAGADTTQAGVHGLLAPWIGGAGADATQAGFTGLLGYWAGGAGSVAEIPTPIALGGGRNRPFRIPVDPLQAKRLAEDELIVLVIVSALPLLH